ncbi:MAG: hypothetical protein ACO1NK_11695 [Sediminibacterium sp.]|jgi:hypothetical protein|uniref:hypothetical protein n=1 Tax=Sediminibacterium sp. TaxID=1917865 RepID=UPI003F70B75E
MDKNSFYNLDYIIELNEKRLSQFSDAYQKNLNKFTNILIIYSAIAVFIVPLTQSLFFGSERIWLNYVCFSLFTSLFLYSLFYTIKLLIPVEVAYLIEPKTYYVDFRLEYEAEGKNKNEADLLVKASYINELEKAVSINNSLFKRKGFFYYRALISGLICCVPYVICLIFHFSYKAEDTQKVEIINYNKISTFNKIPIMPKDDNTSTTTPQQTTSQLPGVNVNDVKPSSPQMIKENFQQQVQKKDSTTSNSNNKQR